MGIARTRCMCCLEHAYLITMQKKYDDEACHVAAEVGVSLKCCIIKTMTESTLVCRLNGLVKYVVENR